MKTPACVLEIVNALTPNQLDTLEQAMRLAHLDIPDMTDSELRSELRAIEPWLFWIDDSCWLHERAAALNAELAWRMPQEGVQRAEGKRPGRSPGSKDRRKRRKKRPVRYLYGGPR